MKLKSKKDDGRRHARPTSERRQFVSYHSSRQSYESSRPSERKSVSRSEAVKTRALSIPVSLTSAFIGLAIIGCLLYTTTLNGSSKFVITLPSGVPALRQAEVYSQAADDILNQSILNKNKVSINIDKIKTKLLDRFPELESVQVVLPLMGHRPIIEAVVAKPAIRLISDGGVYLISGEGRALADTKDLTKGIVIDVPTVTDEASLDIKAGNNVLSSSDVTFITTLVNQLDSKKLEITSITLPPLASELHIKLKGENYYGKFSLVTNPRQSAGQYIAIQNYLKQKNIVPKEYIDARVEEKVYYR